MELIKQFASLPTSEKRWMYLCNLRPTLKEKGLFHDATEQFRTPAEPPKNSDVLIKFRTVRYNVDTVRLIVDGISYDMQKTSRDKKFDYYTTTIHVEEAVVSYYFEVYSGKTLLFYNQLGARSELNQFYNFKINPGFVTPEWVRGAVMYQIYVDRFCNGDKTNDVLTDEYSYIGDHVHHVDNWDRYPASMDVREFYGGDLAGVMQKLDYLQDLGVQCIYFNPLFVSPSNHKYDSQDYDYIDPHIGVIADDRGDVLPEGDNVNQHATRFISRVTSLRNLEASNAYFAMLVDEIHRRGMRVIMDGVFNHCGSFNKWLDRERIYEGVEGFSTGAYVSKDSPYSSFFQFNDENAWPYNHTYNGWWGFDTLPKLNYEGSKELEDYIIGIGRKWVSPPYNVDGWRLDVAADLGLSPEYNHHFWARFRDAVKSANPEAVILAEHYGDASSWLQGDQWDTVMNYDAFMEPLTWFLTGMEKHSDSFNPDKIGNATYFFDDMTHNMSLLGGTPTRIAMNELSNHDHSRFLTRTNRTVGRTESRGPKAAEEGVVVPTLKEAVIVQMSWPGAPTIYYGDEAGVCGWTDPDCRRTYPWGHEDVELIKFHKAVIKVHKEVPALNTGSYIRLHGEYGVISFGRFMKGSKAVTIINNDNNEKKLRIHVWELGVLDGDIMDQRILSLENGYLIDCGEYRVVAGTLEITMPPLSGTILVKREIG